jgi:CIC family chloride channel protein
LTQTILSDRYAMEALLAVFCLRFVIGPLSYAAGTPGGLFTPIMLLGASFGALFAGLLNYFVPALGLSAVACAVVGMAALFAACVRAPLTGIVIVVEMTGRVDLTLALIVASLGAMIVTILFKSEPIYDSLKQRMLQQELTQTPTITGRTRWGLSSSSPRNKVQ